MIHTGLKPDPKCCHCSGTGRVRVPFDCECLLREAKVSLWRRAVKALSRCSGEPQPKGRSMVAGRRDFMKLMATGAVAAALPKPAPIAAFLKQTSFYDQIAAASTSLGQDMSKVLNRAGAVTQESWYSIYGQNVLEASNIVLVETA